MPLCVSAALPGSLGSWCVLTFLSSFSLLLSHILKQAHTRTLTASAGKTITATSNMGTCSRIQGQTETKLNSLADVHKISLPKKKKATTTPKSIGVSWCCVSLMGCGKLRQAGLENISGLIQTVEWCIIYSLILIFFSFYFLVTETRHALLLLHQGSRKAAHFPTAFSPNHCGNRKSGTVIFRKKQLWKPLAIPAMQQMCGLLPSSG